MTRTQRRRAARAYHLAEDAAIRAKASARRAEAAVLLSMDAWTQLTDTLDGMLRVEFPSPFTDLEFLCPKEAWLVIDLTHVRAARPNLRHELAYVLDSFTQVLIHAETVRPWSDLYATFWTRVLTSDMIQARPDADEPWMCRFIQLMRAKGTQVAFEWRGRCLDSNHVIEQLKKTLATAIDVPSRHHVPVQFALRFEDCQLTAKRLHAIYTLLNVPATTGDRTFLFDACTLRELSLCGTTLHAQNLQDLALSLEQPSTRGIDGLKLDSTMPGQAHQTTTYTAAFRRVLAATLCTKPTGSSGGDRGVSLSLRNFSIFNAALIDALTSALSEATRSLRGLSVACWCLRDNVGVHSFSRLLMTPLPTATDDFDLDLSCIRGPYLNGDDTIETIFDQARIEMIEQALPRIRTAFRTGSRLSCRLLHFWRLADDPEMETPLNADVTMSCIDMIPYYEVRDVTENGCFQIVLPKCTEDGDDIVCWTSPWAMANIRIDDAYVLRCGRSGLNADRCRPADSAHDVGRALPVLGLVAVTGAELTRLSLRFNVWDAELLLSLSPRLEEFHIEHDSEEGQFWKGIEMHFSGQSLAVVNASRSGLQTAALRELLEFPNLRHLNFAHNNVGVPDLEALHETLVRNPKLELVDVRHEGFDLWKKKKNKTI